MRMVDVGGHALHLREAGDPRGAPVVFAHALGTDLRIWDAVLAHLPTGLRLLRYDLRGHGLSDCPPGPYGMGALVRDAERLLDALNVRGAVFVGLSLGGMVAQGLAIKRLDQIRALVLSNTATKIDTKDIWDRRIAEIRAGGMAAQSSATLERWFSRDFRAGPGMAIWRNMLERQTVEGYTGCAAAVAGTDFYTPTSGLRLPVLGIAGSEDGSTPPDLVRETVALIPGSRFELIRRAGHLPCVERPVTYAALLTRFLKEIGHV
ncbi:3-oxoadipate enol-lactonase [Salinihabitans flavidus]|nr:3-oxoadipate enol-lactonase [Salinihabitans flavidus]